RQNQIAVRADHVLQHAEDVDLEFLHVGAVEHGSPDPHHAGPNLVDPHLTRGGAERREADTGEEQGDAESSGAHGFRSIIREKCLLVKEKWAIELTSDRAV